MKRAADTSPANRAARKSADLADEDERLQFVEGKIDRGIEDCSARYHGASDQMQDRMGVIDEDDYADFMSSQGDVQRYGQELDELRGRKGDPYFFHLDLRRSDGTVESHVVGKVGVTVDGNPVVLDWRSAKGGLYAPNFKTQKTYEVKGKRYTPLLRRHVAISNATILDVSTEYDASTPNLPGEVIDPFLRQVLYDRRRDYRLSDIIVTIQANQNEIMRQPDDASFVVQGCAGSGKTMILLHRLSYLVNNPDRPNVDPDRFAVITPGDFFDRHIQELGTQLDVNKIRRFDLPGFYLYLIDRMGGSDTYEEKRGERVATRAKIPAPKSVNPTEATLGANLLSEVYSTAFVNRLFDEAESNRRGLLQELENDSTLDWLRGQGLAVPPLEGGTPYAAYRLLSQDLGRLEAELERRRAVVERAKGSLAAARQSLEDTRSSVRKLGELVAVLQEVTEAYLLSEDDFGGALEAPKRVSSTPEQDLQLFAEHVYLNRLGHALDKEALELPLFRGALRDANLQAALEAYAEVFKVLSPPELRLMGHDDERIQQRKARIAQCEADLEAARRDLEDYEREAPIDHLRERLDLLDARWYTMCTDVLLQNVYDAHGANYVSNRNYPHRIFVRLALCVAYYGHATTGLRHLSIDEAQDVSPAEYAVLRKALGEGVAYNLYGDVGQRITSWRGVDDWCQVEGVLGVRTYHLDQNYRNTREITDYCNSRFGMRMTGIGLKGAQVRKCTLEQGAGELLRLRGGHRGIRLAVVHNLDPKVARERLKPLLGREAAWGFADAGMVSVITVLQSKGLEFDGVLVIEDGLSRNELYVACTRALDNLLVANLGAAASAARGGGGRVAGARAADPAVASPGLASSAADASGAPVVGTPAAAAVATGTAQLVSVRKVAKAVYAELGVGEDVQDMCQRFVNSLANQRDGLPATKDALGIARGIIAEHLDQCLPLLAGEGASGEGLTVDDCLAGWEWSESKVRVIVVALISHAEVLVEQKRRDEERARQEKAERERAREEELVRRTRAAGDSCATDLSRSLEPTEAISPRMLLTQGDLQLMVERIAHERGVPVAIIQRADDVVCFYASASATPASELRKRNRRRVESQAIRFIYERKERYKSTVYGARILADDSYDPFVLWRSDEAVAEFFCSVVLDALVLESRRYFDGIVPYGWSGRWSGKARHKSETGKRTPAKATTAARTSRAKALAPQPAKKPGQAQAKLSTVDLHRILVRVALEAGATKAVTRKANELLVSPGSAMAGPSKTDQERYWTSLEGVAVAFVKKRPEAYRSDKYVKRIIGGKTKNPFQSWNINRKLAELLCRVVLDALATDGLDCFDQALDIHPL